MSIGSICTLIIIFAISTIGQAKDLEVSIKIPMGLIHDVAFEGTEMILDEISPDGAYPIDPKVKNTNIIERFYLNRKVAVGRSGRDFWNFIIPRPRTNYVNIYLGARRSGSVLLPLVNSEKPVRIKTGRRFGRGRFLRTNTVGGELHLQTCFNIPGITLKTNKVVLSGYAGKSDVFPFGGDAKAKGDVDIIPGSITTGNTLACGEIAIGVRAGQPRARITRVDSVKFQNVKGHGLQVEAKLKSKGWIFNLFSSVVRKEVTQEVEKKALEELRKKVNTGIQDLKSGRYMSAAVIKNSLQPHIKILNEELASMFGEVNMAQETFAYACMAAFGQIDALGISRGQSRELASLCMASKITLKGFQRIVNQDSRCRNSFVALKEGNKNPNKKWRSDCGVKAVFALSVDDRLSRVSTCLVTAWNQKKNPLHRCSKKLVNLVESYQQQELDDLVQKAVSSQPIRFTRSQLNEALDHIEQVTGSKMDYEFGWLL